MNDIRNVITKTMMCQTLDKCDDVREALALAWEKETEKDKDGYIMLSCKFASDIIILLNTMKYQMENMQLERDSD